MAEAPAFDGRGRPRIYTIPAHRGFADALVAGLLARHGGREMGLARLTLLLPSRRAMRSITEAFVRAGSGDGGGLLLPRMVVVGDLDLEEALGPLLDPLGGEEVPPAVDPTERWLRLAEIVTAVEGEDAPKGAALFARAAETAATIDRLTVEAIDPQALLDPEVIALVKEQARHWENSTRRFLHVHLRWQAELAASGEVDPPTRRNLLFARAAAAWRAAPPPHPVIAAGITSASPSLARLLRVVSELPGGAVVLPDLDITLADDVWEALGVAGQPDEPGGDPFGRDDAVSHPQYHMKLLLNRMGVARGEAGLWHRAGAAASPPARARAISNLFLTPAASARWVDLAEPQRRLSAVRMMEAAHPGEEAQAIAILMREALETPEKRVALVTPDRGLAARVVAHLARWGIAADDTAGRPLSQTAAGRVILLLAEVAGEGAPPVPLIALLGHPLVGAGEESDGRGRAAWLEHVRWLDKALRGPRPDAGLAALRALVKEHSGRAGGIAFANWWEAAEVALAPLMALGDEAPLAALLDALAVAGEALCGEALWSGADGRALAGLLDEISDAARGVTLTLALRDATAVLRAAMDRVAVRPPWGGHPRVAIYGLLEARMARADLMIAGGLTEGVWPARPAADPLLPPAVLRHLGVAGGGFRIGLSAHDLAGVLGAPQVVLSWARRDEAGPVSPSRFVLRMRAMLGPRLADDHAETRALELARDIDTGRQVAAHPRPSPRPGAEQRRVSIAATALDRLRGDPYQFYASAILGLSRLDGLDAAPSPAWRGTAVHKILEVWHKAGSPRGALRETADAVLDTMSAHPLSRSLWRPRLLAGLAWIDAEMVAQEREGRVVLASEASGAMLRAGIRIHGRADRIDRLTDGTLAIVDYKTGAPPSPRMVEAGFALQLGLIGLIAAAGGFDEVAGEPVRFEYWALTRNPKSATGFGKVSEPVKEGQKRSGLLREEFLDRTQAFLDEAIARWILGDEGFTARENPDLPVYHDYDQLMRLDEWIARMGDRPADRP